MDAEAVIGVLASLPAAALVAVAALPTGRSKDAPGGLATEDGGPFVGFAAADGGSPMASNDFERGRQIARDLAANT